MSPLSSAPEAEKTGEQEPGCFQPLQQAAPRLQTPTRTGVRVSTEGTVALSPSYPIYRPPHYRTSSSSASSSAHLHHQRRQSSPGSLPSPSKPFSQIVSATIPSHSLERQPPNEAGPWRETERALRESLSNEQSKNHTSKNDKSAAKKDDRADSENSDVNGRRWTTMGLKRNRRDISSWMEPAVEIDTKSIKVKLPNPIRRSLPNPTIQSDDHFVQEYDRSSSLIRLPEHRRFGTTSGIPILKSDTDQTSIAKEGNLHRAPLSSDCDSKLDPGMSLGKAHQNVKELTEKEWEGDFTNKVDTTRPQWPDYNPVIGQSTFKNKLFRSKDRTLEEALPVTGLTTLSAFQMTMIIPAVKAREEGPELDEPPASTLSTNHLQPRSPLRRTISSRRVNLGEATAAKDHRIVIDLSMTMPSENSENDSDCVKEDLSGLVENDRSKELLAHENASEKRGSFSPEVGVNNPFFLQRCNSTSSPQNPVIFHHLDSPLYSLVQRHFPNLDFRLTTIPISEASPASRCSPLTPEPLCNPFSRRPSSESISLIPEDEELEYVSTDCDDSSTDSTNGGREGRPKFSLDDGVTSSTPLTSSPVRAPKTPSDCAGGSGGIRRLTGNSPAMRSRFQPRVLEFRSLSPKEKKFQIPQMILRAPTSTRIEVDTREEDLEASIDTHLIDTSTKSASNTEEVDKFGCDCCERNTKSGDLTLIKPCLHLLCFSCVSVILNVVCSGHPKGGSGTARCIACGEVVGNVVPKVLSTPEVREKVFKFEQQQQRVTRKEVEAELMDGPHAIPSVIRIDNVPWFTTYAIVEDFVSPDSLNSLSLQPIHILINPITGKSKDYLYVELKSKRLARKIMKEKQNAMLGNDDRARPVIVTMSNESQLIEELRPRSQQELINLLGFCDVALTIPSPLESNKSRYPAANVSMTPSRGPYPTSPLTVGSRKGKTRYAPFYSTLSILSKLDRDHKDIWWDMFFVSAGVISILAKSLPHTDSSLPTPPGAANHHLDHILIGDGRKKQDQSDMAAEDVKMLSKLFKAFEGKYNVKLASS